MSDDTVKRSDAIKAVDAFLGTDSIVERIKRLPSADRPQGEWIKPKNEIAIRLNQWICSNCNYLVDGKHNYCPNCGARMKGSDDAD